MPRIPTALKLLAGAAAGAAVTAVASRFGAEAIVDRESRGRLTGRWVRVDGRRVFARVPRAAVRRAAEPIVLVHGFGMSSSYMVPLAVRLLPEFTVLAPDLPGFGRSAKPREALTIPALADALRGWLDAMDMHRAVLVGHSLGCQVVADLAARAPERVTRLVLIAPTVEPSARRVDRQLGRLALDVPLERPSLLLLVENDWIRAGVRRMAETTRHALDDRIELKLPRIAAPTLVVRGERDPMVSRQWAERVVSLLPDGRLREIPGAGHAVHYDERDALVAAIRPFLTSEARARAD